MREALVVRAVLRQPHRLLKRLSVPPRHPLRRRRGARAVAPARRAVGARAATETRALGYGRAGGVKNGSENSRNCHLQGELHVAEAEVQRDEVQQRPLEHLHACTGGTAGA